MIYFLFAIVAVICVYTARHYLFTLNRLFGFQRHPYIDIDTADWPPVTVLVAAHNEEKVIATIPSRLRDAPPAGWRAVEYWQQTAANSMEAGGSYEGLSSGFGHWDGGYARGVLVTGNQTWNVEINGQQQFGDFGVYLAAGDTYTYFALFPARFPHTPASYLEGVMTYGTTLISCIPPCSASPTIFSISAFRERRC